MNRATDNGQDVTARLGRRTLLKLGGLVAVGGAAGALLAACGSPAAPPAPSTPASAKPSPASAAPASAKPAGSAAASPAAAAKPSSTNGKLVRAAFVYLGTTNDKGWTNAHDDGRKYLEQQLKGQVETVFAENVPEGAESQRVFEDFAQKGASVVYGTSFGYMDFMLAAAQKYPDVKFEHNTGFKTLPNLGTYGAAQEDARYVAGLISGKMTKSNVLGFIGSFPIPEVIRDMNGWARGVQIANPQAKIHTVWINSWFDPPKETTAANSLLDLNADVLASVTDSPAMAQAAAAKKRYSVGSDSDQTSYAPDYMLICPFWVWGIHYVKSVQSVIDGTWKNSQVYYHMKDGVSSITAPNKIVPADVAKLAEDAIAGLKAGTLDIWKGPLKDNKGNVIVPDGKSIGDAFKGTPLPGQSAADGYVQSEQMNWALDNIVDAVPKP